VLLSSLKVPIKIYREISNFKRKKEIEKGKENIKGEKGRKIVGEQHEQNK
jgi:hypothetical protein